MNLARDKWVSVTTALRVLRLRIEECSGVPGNFVREGGGGSTNSVEHRGQRERGSGGGTERTGIWER